MEDNNIRVAIRVRPQVPKEVIDMCTVCTNVTPNEPQVWLGKDKGFTFDHVFNMDSRQEAIYDNTVRPLIEGCFEGFNATVLAYGQTGSGKTFTMGTGLDICGNPYEKGIIPRAVDHLFEGIRERQQEARDNGYPIPDFKVNAQFLELYNEEIIDLLAEERTKHSQIKIREGAEGGMYLMGGTTRPVTSLEDTLTWLKTGALSRTTASTQMNAQSSRSHAIFTLHVKQQRVVSVNGMNEKESEETELAPQEFETLTAKFHFVDLAGSERLKRTGATGDRAKEGISINSGLLALGNVISALGDRTKRANHVPYRDSKLTRLLQDSLGGNSRTLMIACISPSDRDFMETMNTLRYANRAKNIKNRVHANQDKSSQTITLLRRQIQELQLELVEYKQGKRVLGEDGTESVNDMYHENSMLQVEINNLKTRVKALQETNSRLSERNAKLLCEKETGTWITSENGKSDISEIVQRYLSEIEDLRTKLIEAEETCSQLRKQVQRNRVTMSPYANNAVAMAGDYYIKEEPETSSTDVLLDEAKKDVARLKQKASRELFPNENGADKQDTNGNEVGDTVSLNGDENEAGSESSSEDYDEEATARANNEAEYALLELTNEITVKEKLIMELEKSQRKLNTLKHHYEDKLIQLQEKINAIEIERDQVLTKLSAGNQSNEKSKVKEDYQKKLNSLQSEMKKLQVAKKEHEKSMKNQAQYELQMRQLRNEVSDMKKTKVRLVSQMKDEAQKHREIDLKNHKKIAQLSKQDRLKEVKIKSLETEKQRMTQQLKRKEVEVNNLKKRPTTNMSDKVAGRIPVSRRVTTLAAEPVVAFSPKVAKQKWQRLELNINKLVLIRQNITANEQQMEKYMLQRDQVSHSLEKAKKKYDRACKANKLEEVNALLEEMEGIEEHVNFLSQNIRDCQSVIVQLEESKEEFEGDDISTFIQGAPNEEIKYIFDKVLSMAINNSMLATQKEEEKKEFELKFKQLNDSSMIQEQLLHHVLDTTFVGDPSSEACFVDDHNEDAYEQNNLVSDYDKFVIKSSPQTRAEKARRQTRTHNELLYETSFQGSPELLRKSPPRFDDPMSQSLMLNPRMLNSDIHRVPSAPSLKEMQKPTRFEPTSPSVIRKRPDRNMIETRRLNKTTNNLAIAASPPPHSSPLQNYTRQISMEYTDTTPPVSPSMSRKNRDENVFSRLTSGTASTIVSYPETGIINPFNGKPAYEKTSPLVCTHIAEGHSRAVLSVAATNDVMFSGSKDCTVKIWDLHTGRELQSLLDHPEAVSIVRYNEYNRLAFTVSKSHIKVWDPRDNPARCIKTLNSSGLVSQTASVAQKGNEMAHGETKIFDIQLSPYGTTLFSTCGNMARYWDLRMFYCVGKLNTGHKANVTCMAVEEAGVDNNIVITGSKDHYIKIFEVQEGIGGIQNPKATLSPPHYDGIEALKIHNDFLFSASRDACIKKWDLSNQTLVQSLNQAHKDWIQSLSIIPQSNTLISGCRTGFLKLWSTDTCQLVGDIKAHSASINCVETNSSLIFTASGDNTVGIWRSRSSNDSSPETVDYQE
ncbi:Kinesin-like protein KIF21A [Halotydeus destructor]|nr:Kinesin-like protein KIF21A [Halotydeus destructor]